MDEAEVTDIISEEEVTDFSFDEVNIIEVD